MKFIHFKILNEIYLRIESLQFWKEVKKALRNGSYLPRMMFCMCITLQTELCYHTQSTHSQAKKFHFGIRFRHTVGRQNWVNHLKALKANITLSYISLSLWFFFFLLFAHFCASFRLSWIDIIVSSSLPVIVQQFNGWNFITILSGCICECVTWYTSVEQLWRNYFFFFLHFPWTYNKLKTL